MIKIGRNETQYQMSDEFYQCVKQFIKSKNMTLDDFSSYVRIDKYLLYKVMNRKIKMHCYLSLLKKIERYVPATGIVLGDKQPTICSKKCD